MTSGRDIVVVAASAGGLMPLRTMLSGLPAGLPAALFVVLQDVVRLSRGPRQNGLRPAADPLFRSAALYKGPRTTAVVLSGTLDDAALGGATVERHGGRVVVQDPVEADYNSMPLSVIAATGHAIVTRTARLAQEVTRLATEEFSAPVPDIAGPDKELAAEIEGLLAGGPETDKESRDYTGLTCPECGGPLFSAHEAGAETFDCLVGHRWSPQSLFADHSASVERGLWLAIRSLEERARLATRLAEDARGRRHPLSADQFATAALAAQRSADAIRKVVQGVLTEVAPERDEA